MLILKKKIRFSPVIDNINLPFSPPTASVESGSQLVGTQITTLVSVILLEHSLQWDETMQVKHFNCVFIYNVHVDQVSNVHDKNLENMHCNSSSCVLQITSSFSPKIKIFMSESYFGLHIRRLNTCTWKKPLPSIFLNQPKGLWIHRILTFLTGHP